MNLILKNGGSDMKFKNILILNLIILGLGGISKVSGCVGLYHFDAYINGRDRSPIRRIISDIQDRVQLQKDFGPTSSVKNPDQLKSFVKPIYNFFGLLEPLRHQEIADELEKKREFDKFIKVHELPEELDKDLSRDDFRQATKDGKLYAKACNQFDRIINADRLRKYIEQHPEYNFIKIPKKYVKQYGPDYKIYAERIPWDSYPNPNMKIDPSVFDIKKQDELLDTFLATLSLTDWHHGNFILHSQYNENNILTAQPISLIDIEARSFEPSIRPYGHDHGLLQMPELDDPNINISKAMAYFMKDTFSKNLAYRTGLPQLIERSD